MLGPGYASEVRVKCGWRRGNSGGAGWADAHAALSLADQSSPLAAEDLELLATAAYLLGHMEACLAALRRAPQLHAEGGDPRRAARCAFWLTFHYGSRGDLAQASGWFGRANRLLEHKPQECAVHGYLLISTAYQHLMASGFAEAREMLAAWSRSRCSSKGAPWCGKAGSARALACWTRPWWRS